MSPETLLALLVFASGAKTDEEKARVAWRASDYMWRDLGTFEFAQSRAFNNLLQDQKWPFIKLYSAEEIEARKAELRAMGLKV